MKLITTLVSFVLGEIKAEDMTEGKTLHHIIYPANYQNNFPEWRKYIHATY
jgi:hypothetical protein